jgi:hypothetical protein
VTVHDPVGEHATASSVDPGSIVAVADQAVPFQIAARSPPTATHSDGSAHDTSSADGGRIDRGADQVAPFQVISPPVESTATQKDAVAHETAVGIPVGSTSTGLAHELPFHKAMPPIAATHDVGEPQAMSVAPPQALICEDHVDPFRT